MDKMYRESNPQLVTSKAVQALMANFRAELLRRPGAMRETAPTPMHPQEIWRWEYPIRFGAGGAGSDRLRDGWSYSEEDYTWSDGSSAVIELPPLNDPRDVLISVVLKPFCPPGITAQRVTVVFNQISSAAWWVDRPGRYAVLLRRQGGRVPEHNINFLFPDCKSPKFYGMSDDSRKLAVAVHEMTAFLI